MIKKDDLVKVLVDNPIGLFDNHMSGKIGIVLDTDDDDGVLVKTGYREDFWYDVKDVCKATPEEIRATLEKVLKTGVIA